jgi:transposase
MEAPVEKDMLDARQMQLEGKKQWEIAAALGVTDRTVRNYLAQAPHERKKPERKSKLDPFKEELRTVIEETPNKNGELIYQSLTRKGYTGKRSILKEYLTILRLEESLKASIRFETEPGHQAQIDWVEFGKQWVDGQYRKLYAFTMILGYSRQPFVRFTTDMKSPTLLACHEEAFRSFGGIPAECLYDNMKTAWHYDGEKWVVNKRLEAFACHYGFVVRRCKVRRPQTKGKIERFNQYLEGNFFQPLDGQQLTLDELNAKAQDWILSIQDNLISGIGETRRERFTKERPYLKPLPQTSFDVRESVPVMVSNESCVTWKTNRYSVQPKYIGKELIARPDVFKESIDLYINAQYLRTIRLLNESKHARVMDPCDLVEIQARWRKEQEKRLKIVPSTQPLSPNYEPEVMTRSSADYDTIYAGALA